MIQRAMLDSRTLDEKAARIAQETHSTPGRIKAILIAAMKDTENLKVKQPAPTGGISIRGASRKYGVDHSTISRWAKKGYITVLLRTDYETYIDESNAANVIAEYKKDPGRGKYTLKHKLSAA